MPPEYYNHEDERMSNSIILDDAHFEAALERARVLGKTPESYIASLIDAEKMTFDEILEPVRKSFAESGVSEDELDDVIYEARKEIHARSQIKLP